MRVKGLTPSDYDEALTAQGGRCAICGTDDPGNGKAWHIDHDHLTGAVRGLLCHNCNTGLGQFVHDPTLLRIAAVYVEVPADLRSTRPLFA
jgi:hypothetical protein